MKTIFFIFIPEWPLPARAAYASGSKVGTVQPRMERVKLPGLCLPP
jgi:hypothetical protein